MKVLVKEVATNTDVAALILSAHKKRLPLRKDGWQFNWKKLAQTEDAWLYQLVLQQSPATVEGMLMLTLVNDEMLYMNMIEVAPHNYGRYGKYENVARCLFAFACHKSLEVGKGNYQGFVSFDAKTELIRFYQEKYGATLAGGQKMFFDPAAGEALMNKYFNTK
jgi:hypothetical protein